jgi:hypothetical protein
MDPYNELFKRRDYLEEKQLDAQKILFRRQDRLVDQKKVMADINDDRDHASRNGSDREVLRLERKLEYYREEVRYTKTKIQDAENVIGEWNSLLEKVERQLSRYRRAQDAF